MCSKHVEARNKLIIKFIASSCLILINKYIETHGQQNIKTKQQLSSTIKGGVWITQQMYDPQIMNLDRNMRGKCL